jgi:hypothetical protein
MFHVKHSASTRPTRVSPNMPLCNAPRITTDSRSRPSAAPPGATPHRLASRNPTVRTNQPAHRPNVSRETFACHHGLPRPHRHLLTLPSKRESNSVTTQRRGTHYQPDAHLPATPSRHLSLDRQLPCPQQASNPTPHSHPTRSNRPFPARPRQTKSPQQPCQQTTSPKPSRAPFVQSFATVLLANPSLHLTPSLFANTEL